MVSDRPIVLTALTGHKPADIICCSSQNDYNTLTDYLRCQGIGFQVLTQEEAVKLLIADRCIGAGCYISAINTKENNRRRVFAASLYKDLTRYTGIVSIVEPLELHLSLVAKDTESVTS